MNGKALEQLAALAVSAWPVSPLHWDCLPQTLNTWAESLAVPERGASLEWVESLA